jgi:hypothetical protein
VHYVRARAPWRRFAFALALAGTLVLALSAFAGAAPSRSNEMPTPRQGPTITGAAQEGQTLTGNNGQWLYSNGLGCGSECQYSWQWQRCNAGGGSCGNIAGATNRTYLLSAADVGNRVLAVNTLTKHDCNALNQDCRDVVSSQNSALTTVIAPKPGAAPTSAAIPTITGTPMEEETLTASTGNWNGDQPISLSYQWYRCDTAGANCAPISGATAQTYVLTSTDVGFTIRVTGTATNKWGSNFATSELVGPVLELAPRPGRTTMTIDRISLPHRLTIDKYTIKPTAIRSLTPFTAKFRVSDDRGFHVVGALVQVTGVPYGEIQRVREVETDAAGWATFTLTPTARLQLVRGNALYLYVRARKPGEKLDAGVSNTKLVRIKVVAAAG